MSMAGSPGTNSSAGAPAARTSTGAPGAWTSTRAPGAWTSTGAPAAWTSTGAPADWTSTGAPAAWTSTGCLSVSRYRPLDAFGATAEDPGPAPWSEEEETCELLKRLKEIELLNMVEETPGAPQREETISSLLGHV